MNCGSMSSSNILEVDLDMQSICFVLLKMHLNLFEMSIIIISYWTSQGNFSNITHVRRVNSSEIDKGSYFGTSLNLNPEV